MVLLAAALVLATAAVLIREARDLGAGVLPQGEGRERSGAFGASLVGLAWRLQRATVAGWCAGAAALGAVAGALGPLVSETVSGVAPLQELISRLVPGGRAELIDVFITALLGMAGVFASASGIRAVLRLRAEEVEGRAELLLAVPKSRARWLGANLSVVAAAAVLVSGTAGAAAAIGLGLSGTRYGPGASLVSAALAHVPAALVFLTATALVFAAAPRASIPLGWGMFAAGLILGEFGELFGMPVWLQDLSPFRHSSAMPLEPCDPAGALAMAVIAAALAGLAAYRVQRRDLTG